MRKHTHFWFTTLARGFAALLIGSAIWFVPDMARSLLLLPMAVAFSVLTLAAYGVVDSSLVLLSSTMSESRRTAIALGIQGALGILVGVLLFGVLYERVRLEWFFVLAAVQALCLGVTEVVVARHTISHAKTLWNNGAAVVAFSVALAYLTLRLGFVDVLSSPAICWLIYGYLVMFGLFQIATASRMLSHGHHPGEVIDTMVRESAAAGRGRFAPGE